MRGKAILWLMFVLCSLSKVEAQFTLPRIDVEAKISQSVLPGGEHEDGTLKAMETTNIALGAHWQVTQNIAVGWVYSNSLRGSGYNSNDFNFNFGSGDSKAYNSYSGFDVRLSAGRAVRWRPYVNLNYGRIEIVEDKGFRLASKQNAVGGGIGIMRRYGNHLYWNVFEASVKSFSEKLFWADVSFMIEIKTGFTYNIGKKK
ncbi:MAG: hypothetical protein JST48_02630 [Bacteroidetes bacterium]|nr:hypothetical protein [Bacteroidota bacterium]